MDLIACRSERGNSLKQRERRTRFASWRRARARGNTTSTLSGATTEAARNAATASSVRPSFMSTDPWSTAWAASPKAAKARKRESGCLQLVRFAKRCGDLSPALRVARKLPHDACKAMLKNSEIEPRKSRFRARRVTSAGSPYARVYGRVAGGKTGRSAEPLRNFSSRLPAAS